MESAQPIQAFDLHRMFLGDQTNLLFLAEIAFRTAVMYGYALVFARVVGKRAVGQVTPFEFIVIIIVGSAAGSPMFQPHVPLVHGLLVLTVVMALQLALSSLTSRSERAEDVLESEPVLMVENGKVVDRALGAGRLSRRELMMRLRQQSIGDVGQVERAFLEPDGSLSVFQANPEKQKKTESTAPSR